MWQPPYAAAQPFVWIPGYGLFQLGVLPGQSGGYAVAINNSFVMVGESGVRGPSVPTRDRLTAVRWTLGGGRVESLNSLLANGEGWHVERAISVNNLGAILAVGTFNNESHGVLLVPADLAPVAAR